MRSAGVFDRQNSRSLCSSSSDPISYADRSSVALSSTPISSILSYSIRIRASDGYLFDPDSSKRHFGRRSCLAVEFWPLKTGQAALFRAGGASFPQQRLNFWPDLQGQRALRGVIRG